MGMEADDCTGVHLGCRIQSHPRRNGKKGGWVNMGTGTRGIAARKEVTRRAAETARADSVSRQGTQANRWRWVWR